MGGIKIPQAFVQSDLPASSGQPEIPASAFGADTYKALGEVGKAAFGIVLEAEENKAEQQRFAIFNRTKNKVQYDTIAKHNELKDAPDSLTHVKAMEEWATEYDRDIDTEIQDTIVRGAVKKWLGEYRGQVGVKVRDEARAFAMDEDVTSTQESIDLSIQQAHGSGMDPDEVKNTLASLDALHDHLEEGLVDKEKVRILRREARERLFDGGVKALAKASPRQAFNYVQDNYDALVTHVGTASAFKLLSDARSYMEKGESDEWTHLERVSAVTEYQLSKAIRDIRTRGDLKVFEDAVDVAMRGGQLKGSDAKTVLAAANKHWEGGGTSDPEVVRRLTSLIVTSAGEGVGWDTLYLSEGLDKADRDHLTSLKISLEKRDSVFGNMVSRIRETVVGGPFEEITPTKKVALNAAIKELSVETNYGNSAPSKIRQSAEGIINRLTRTAGAMTGSNPYRDVYALDRAIRRGELADEGTIDQFREASPTPPDLGDWGKVSRAWFGNKISKQLALSYWRKYVLEPFNKSNKKDKK